MSAHVGTEVPDGIVYGKESVMYADGHEVVQSCQLATLEP